MKLVLLVLGVKPVVSEWATYTINRSQLAQIFWPGGKPPVGGGAGRSTGALTCFVTGVPNLCESKLTYTGKFSLLLV